MESLIDKDLPRLIHLRHELHAHPQLAYQETFASSLVQDELQRLNIPFQAGLAGGTGVVAWILPEDTARQSLGAVGLRADMDALPITEETGLAYASLNNGLMHACGHDGHTTILLGAATVLSRQRDRLPRPVKLLFQPAEEQLAGAVRMIEDGVLTEQVGGVAVERLYGLHGWPNAQLGTVASRPGPICAAADVFRIVIRGKGGHGAMPHLTSDPILASAQLITALQSVVSRNLEPVRAGVITVSMVEAGTAENIIPEQVTLRGTIRALAEDDRAFLHRRLREIAEQLPVPFGCSAEVEIQPGYPVLENDPEATRHALEAAAQVVAPEAITAPCPPSMGAEDFAFYAHEVPCCYLRLGLCPPEADSYPGLHTPRFNFNDDALEPGVDLFSRIALTGF